MHDLIQPLIGHASALRGVTVAVDLAQGATQLLGIVLQCFPTVAGEVQVYGQAGGFLRSLRHGCPLASMVWVGGVAAILLRTAAAQAGLVRVHFRSGCR